jgi:hypothetical protein
LAINSSILGSRFVSMSELLFLLDGGHNENQIRNFIFSFTLSPAGSRGCGHVSARTQMSVRTDPRT